MLHFCLFFTILAVASAKHVQGRGFGDEYNWQDLAGGLEEAKTTGKPIMYVFHKSWCGACKNLGPKFASSQAIKNLAEQFVLVNLVDDEHPSDPKFSPDGGYIPRIFFGKSDGSVDHSINNAHANPTYKYYYSNGDTIAAAMQTALQTLKE